MGILTAIVAGVGATALAFSAVPPAPTEPAAGRLHAAIDLGENASVQQLQRELEALEGLSHARIDQVVADTIAAEESGAKGSPTPQPRIAPAILIPLLIGCGISVASGLSSLGGSGWPLVLSAAGLLTSCIPGASQVSIARTIWANRVAIGRVLVSIGVGGPLIVALCGDTRCR